MAVSFKRTQPSMSHADPGDVINDVVSEGREGGRGVEGKWSKRWYTALKMDIDKSGALWLAWPLDWHSDLP